MFTGLVQAKGTLVRRAQHGKDARLVLRGDLVRNEEAIALGESIAVDGVCLTVDVIVEPGSPTTESVFEVVCSSETLDKTTVGSLLIGAPVNLERALAVGGRLGGHIVSGHVDGVGHIAEKTPSGESLVVAIDIPRDLARYIAPKGSICVNGVSLTVNGATNERFDVMLIPHTRDKTSLDTLPIGARVNLEVDLLARYVARLVDHDRQEPAPDSRLLDRLRASGYL